MPFSINFIHMDSRKVKQLTRSDFGELKIKQKEHTAGSGQVDCTGTILASQMRN